MTKALSLANAQQSPADTSALSPLTRSRVYFLIDPAKCGGVLGTIDNITISAPSSTSSSGSELDTRSVVVPVVRLGRIKGATIHKLAARALLDDLERGRSALHIDPARLHQGSEDEINQVRKAAEQIACKWSLVSKWTSFFLAEEAYAPDCERNRNSFLDGVIEVCDAPGDDLLRPRGDARNLHMTRIEAAPVGDGSHDAGKNNTAITLVGGIVYPPPSNPPSGISHQLYSPMPLISPFRRYSSQPAGVTLGDSKSYEKSEPAGVTFRHRMSYKKSEPAGVTLGDSRSHGMSEPAYQTFHSCELSRPLFSSRSLGARTPQGHGLPLQTVTSPHNLTTAERRPETDLIRRLLTYQRFDGAFVFTTRADAVSCLGAPIADAVGAAAATAHITATETTELTEATEATQEIKVFSSPSATSPSPWRCVASVHTAAVLYVLRRDFQSSKELWAMMEYKAATWLASNRSSAESDLASALAPLPGPLSKPCEDPVKSTGEAFWEPADAYADVADAEEAASVPRQLVDHAPFYS